MILMCSGLCLVCSKGLRQRQAALRHREHRKQSWIIRAQLSWPFAEALETWSSGTSLWVEQGYLIPPRFTSELTFLYDSYESSRSAEVDVSCSEVFLNPTVFLHFKPRIRIDWKCCDFSRSLLGWNLHKDLMLENSIRLYIQLHNFFLDTSRGGYKDNMLGTTSVVLPLLLNLSHLCGGIHESICCFVSSPRTRKRDQWPNTYD